MCQVDRAFEHDSDHLPIRAVLGIRVQRHAQKAVRPWEKLDTDQFCEMLKGELPATHRPRIVEALERYVQHITEAIARTADQVLPSRQPSQKARAG